MFKLVGKDIVKKKKVGRILGRKFPLVEIFPEF